MTSLRYVFRFQNRPPPVCEETMIYFHVSLCFHGNEIWDLYLSSLKDLLNLLVVRIQFLRRERANCHSRHHRVISTLSQFICRCRPRVRQV